MNCASLAVKDPEEEKKPIPLKWVLFAIMVFMLSYHLFLLYSAGN